MIHILMGEIPTIAETACDSVADTEIHGLP